MALIDNLVAYYKLDGNSNDSVGGYNLTTGSSSFSSGKIGDSASFNGSSNFLAVRDYLGFNPNGNNNISISLWFYTNSLPVSGSAYCLFFFALDPSSGSRYFYRYYLANTGSLFYLNGRTSTSISITNNTWNHIVFTTDTSQNNSIYYNGTLISTNTANDSASATNNKTFSIGATDWISYRSEALNGKVDELGIWNRVLSPEEVSALYNSGAGLTYPFATYNPAIGRRRLLV